MDFKIRGYQSFCGEFLRTDVKVSQKLVDLMSDDDLIYLRSICSKFETEMFNVLKYYATIAAENEETSNEEANNEETSPESNTENSLSESRTTSKTAKKG